MGKKHGGKGKAARKGGRGDGGGKQRTKGRAGKSKRPESPECSWSLEGQLARMGLRVKTCPADGNCMFHAVADQLEGADGCAGDVRAAVVARLREQKEVLQFFIEDDEDYDAYCDRMAREGQWGGHLELQVISEVYGVNIIVHQHGERPWEIRNHEGPGVRTLHLAYEGGQHYDSVRLASDMGTGPAEPILALEQRAPDGADAEAVKILCASTGCEDDAVAAAVLAECNGSVDEAIEVLVQRLADAVVAEKEEASKEESAAAPEQAADGPSGDCVDAERIEDASDPAEEPENGCAAPQADCDAKEASAAPAAPDPAQTAAEAAEDGGGDDSGADERGAEDRPQSKRKHASKGGVRVPRSGPFPNRPCTCGSKRKYKNCCGVAARAAARRAAASGGGAEVVDAAVGEGVLAKVEVLRI